MQDTQMKRIRRYEGHCIHWCQLKDLVLLIVVAVLLFAQIPSVYAGGDCGAEGDWRSSMIPDRWPPPKVKQHLRLPIGQIKTVRVYKACRGHDRCYETPGAKRQSCDAKFLEDINSECEKVYPSMLELPLREACLLAAKGYYRAVSDHGADAFREAQGIDVQKTEIEPTFKSILIEVAESILMEVAEKTLGTSGAGLLFLNSDFEQGDLRNWTSSGSAFHYQPTQGDNILARKRGAYSEHQGEYWVGTYEKYRGRTGEKPGGRQGDKPTGVLRSEPFSITGNSIGFLIGGGRQIKKLRVVLIVNERPVQKTTGNNSETMNRVIWDVREYVGKMAKIEIHDNASGGWGHINVDDFRYWEDGEG